MPYPFPVHPVLFHIGAIVLPSYGVLAAAGVLLALLLAQRTSQVVRIAGHQVWNLCVIALCSALVGSRLVLVAVNWRDLLRHPMWMLGLAMIHNPLIAAIGSLVGVGAGLLFVRAQRMPLRSTLDSLAAPLCLAAACEQVGGLMAGSGYGTEASVRWAVTYTSSLAARWSGTPLGVALHPVQAYAAAGFLTLGLLLLVLLPVRRQPGDVAGIGLVGAGSIVFLTELWRDPEGRGNLLGGTLDWPQVAAIVLVLGGAFLLREHAAQTGPYSAAMTAPHHASPEISSE